MARSVEEVKSSIKTQIRTYTELDNFTFPENGGSKFSVFNLIIHSVAVGIVLFEVILDNLKSDIQAIADRAPSGNASWLRRQILNFQLGDAITINTTDSTADDYFVPVYDPIDESKRIITRCAITDGAGGTVNIKVAKGVAPNLLPLTSSELTALSDYYNGTGSTQGIGFAGVLANIVSLDADRIRVQADIFYLGQFVEANVKAEVISAINTFLSNFADNNFGGTVFMIKMVDAIQSVQGVSRVKLTEIKARPAAVLLSNASTVDIQGVYQTSSGYIISEDETGNTLNDTITMTRETL